MVAECGSFVAAALTLNISQPALTRTVERGETAVGVELCPRSTRGVERTALYQFQLQALVGRPEQGATLMQRELLLQARADGGEDRVGRGAYGVRAHGWLRRGK
ncbi:hypothetical protein G6F60_015072 [Rhizopus arrhizus]|nr:hypothetical protein G6F60_015072 [Rhizopus arrhizus]